MYVVRWDVLQLERVRLVCASDHRKQIKENERMYKFHFCLDCSYFDLTYAAKVRRTDKRCTFVKVKIES